MKKILTWYYMFTKRLLRHYSFVVILLMIPVLLPIADSVMSKDSSVFKVALSSKDESESAKKAIKRLCESDSIISYEVYDTEKEAEAAVRMQKADAAWVFVEDLDAKIELYASGKGVEPLVKIFEFGTDIRASLAREKLFGSIFPDISYSLYSGFVRNDVLKGKEVSEEEIKSVYEGDNGFADIVKVEELNAETVKETKTNHLTGPLRGLFSIIVVLCGLSAAMLFLSDKKEGKYDYIPGKRRIIPAFGLCFAATVLCSLAVYVALLVSGTYTGFVRESISMLMFIICVTGFCLLMTVIFNSPSRLGATLPFFIILMIALSPIFFNVKMLKCVSLLLPTYYYLHSIYDTAYILYMISYSLIIYTLTLAFNALKSKKA